MRVQKIEYFPDNQKALIEDIKQDFAGEILINLRGQHFGEMEVDSWSILLGVDKYIYLVKIPKQKTLLFEQSKDFFKTPQIDVKSAMELMEL